MGQQLGEEEESNERESGEENEDQASNLIPF
jgi:hypothetical protein